jgi:hypothetical protein
VTGICLWRDSKSSRGIGALDRGHGPQPDDRARKPPIPGRTLPTRSHLRSIRSEISQATRARTISYLRNARYLTIEDVIYLIRDDRARVNRLRTYLSWKEVRKTARKEESSATKGGADVEIEDLEDDLVGESSLHHRFD